MHFCMYSVVRQLFADCSSVGQDQDRKAQKGICIHVERRKKGAANLCFKNHTSYVIRSICDNWSATDQNAVQKLARLWSFVVRLRFVCSCDLGQFEIGAGTPHLGNTTPHLGNTPDGVAG
ncbi:hypothetical protein O6H91_07G058600 [Diphasiastrum complanatum]|uniref:Uncharacterized protein n=1 Tax=Diphasiastrum complanatum TaxID=34168 RepID=A0ACC2D5L1_DIPCM|nr:hypothetical protein O6H91_07G058600 [Diphasiastrum complanatum]